MEKAKKGSAALWVTGGLVTVLALILVVSAGYYRHRKRALLGLEAQNERYRAALLTSEVETARLDREIQRLQDEHEADERRWRQRWSRLEAENDACLARQVELRTELHRQALAKLHSLLEEMDAAYPSHEHLPIYQARDGGHDYYFDVVALARLPAGEPMRERLETLARTVSDVLFQGREIEVLEVSGQGGDLHAILDLREEQVPVDPRKSWYGAFQGSTGGSLTESTLLANFLQPVFKGNWPASVEFYYNGEPFGSWDHVSLGVHERVSVQTDLAARLGARSE